MTEKLLVRLIVITIIIATALIFSPFLMDSDPTIYFIIAKNMALHGHWLDLMTNYGPWLDKPHFPFWATALSFKIFGFHPWSYILPGFIFYLLGGVYTYKLARLLYHHKTIALLSLLIYLTTLRLMLSSLDIRAEAYLLGEIMPACYYWFKYHEKTALKYVLLGALFTGLALMTKGLFVVVTIGSGMVVLWIAQKQWKPFISIKWLSAILLSFIVAMPEFLALYAQFGIKGLQWFFFGSQFGRFFDTGRIIKHHGNASFFIQAFMWAFLPWTLIFVAFLGKGFKKYKPLSIRDKNALIYLLGSFLVTFVMFSVTKFKMDYYTNIVFPFAAILSARYLYGLLEYSPKHIIFTLQGVLALVLVIFVMVLVVVVSVKENLYFVSLNLLPIAFFVYLWVSRRRFKSSEKAIICSVLGVNIGFLMLSLTQTIIASQFSPGYMIANVINRQALQLPVYEYQQETNLSVYLKGDNARPVDDLSQLPLHSSYYLVMDSAGSALAIVLKRWPCAQMMLKQESLKLSQFNRRIFLRGPARAPDYQVLLKIN